LVVKLGAVLVAASELLGSCRRAWAIVQNPCIRAVCVGMCCIWAPSAFEAGTVLVSPIRQHTGLVVLLLQVMLYLLHDRLTEAPAAQCVL
jgi:hypothetical protein